MLIGEKFQIIPAGPRTIKVKDKYGRRVIDHVIGYNAQPLLTIYGDPGGTRTLDPRWVFTK